MYYCDTMRWLMFRRNIIYFIFHISIKQTHTYYAILIPNSIINPPFEVNDSWNPLSLRSAVNNYVQHWQCIRIITDRGRFKKIMTRGGFRATKKTWIRHWACITLIIHADVCTCLSGLAGEAWILVLPGARDNRKVHVPLPARATSTWLIADRRLQHSAELRPARPRPHGLQVVLGRRGGIGTDLATWRFRVSWQWRRVHPCRFTPVFVLLGYPRSIKD